MYKNIIDNILNEIKNELTSDHKEVTKALNLEYYKGKLQGLYTMVKSISIEKFIDTFKYREEERELLYVEAEKHIRKVYDIANERPA